jgi:hypothetical protein
VLNVDGKELAHSLRVEGEAAAVPRFLAEDDDEEKKDVKDDRIDD